MAVASGWSESLAGRNDHTERAAASRLAVDRSVGGTQWPTAAGSASRTRGGWKWPANVPGPPMPVDLAGSKVEAMTGWVCISGNQAMSFTI
jgi:WS/DGAT C-terminal domain